MSLCAARFLLVLSLGAVCSQAIHASETLSPIQQDYLNSLLRSSLVQDLASQRTWQLLLHYRTDLLGSGVTSEIDDTDFFLALTGKTDPRAELEATLKAFFSSAKTGSRSQSPQCEYPARYRWLDSQLDFDPSLMPVRECEALERWRELIDAKSVSLVFSSYYFNNPASMFGHTLLRVNSADDAKPSLLDFAISYAADTEGSDNFFDYAWNGVSGAYEGRFTVYPYYDMVKLYNDLENRDLWEYQLDLSTEQVDFMLLHAWELVNTHFEFYFMRENCSYHLLSLLEVADPELNFRDQHVVWTLPTETLKQVAETPGMVQEIVYRPSLRSQLELQLLELTTQEREYVRKLVRDPGGIEPEKRTGVPDVRLEFVIDTAILYSQYVGIADKDKTEQQERKRYDLLVQRSKLDVGSTEIPLSKTDEPISPDRSHDPFRFSISTGNTRFDGDAIRTEDEPFVEFSLQPGFHDLLSREQGHAPDSQIRVLSLTARYGTDNEEWWVQELALIDIISLSPVSSLFNEPSWKLNIEWERNQDGACPDCTPFILNPGIGITLQTNLHRKEIYYAFLEANLELDHELESDYRGGLGVTVGILFDASRQWRIGLTANRTSYTEGAEGYVSRLELQQRFHRSRNLEFVFDLTKVEQNEEGKLGFAYYF